MDDPLSAVNARRRELHDAQRTTIHTLTEGEEGSRLTDDAPTTPSVDDIVAQITITDFEYVWTVLLAKFKFGEPPPVGLMALAGDLTLAMAINRTRYPT